MSRYLVIIEKTATGFSAYSPDLPGCVAAGSTRKEVEQKMRDAIEFHIEGLRLVSPEWHGMVLAGRERKLASGEDMLIDWETAKKQLRAHLSR